MGRLVEFYFEVTLAAVGQMIENPKKVEAYMATVDSSLDQVIG
jgi:carbon monoxide dehydrogenase subunit G